jgi:hypothetical protein
MVEFRAFAVCRWANGATLKLADPANGVKAIAAELTGEVVRAGDSGYEAARIGWNRLYSRYPEAIVFCAEAQDVVNAVEWARERGIALRARRRRQP